MARGIGRVKGGQPVSVADPEILIAKTVKLPRSLDDRLRQYCAGTRRTGQDVMHDAIRLYLERAERAGVA